MNTDGRDYYLFRFISPSQLDFSKIVDDVWTQIATFSYASTNDTWYNLKVAANGNAFTFYVNGVSTGSGSDTSLVGSGTVGLYTFDQTADFDNVLVMAVDPTPTPTNTPTPTPTNGYVYFVATNGNDDNPGTEAQPFLTTSKGISVLTPGDTLLIKSGTYTEPLFDIPSGTSWDTPVTIAAYPGDTVTIRPTWDYVVYVAYSHHVVLDGLVLDGINVTTSAVLIDEEAHHIRIKNSEVKNANESGILIGNFGSIDSDYNEFLNLDVHHNGRAGSGDGINIESSHNLVDHCLVHHNSVKWTLLSRHWMPQF
jgi:hypothetical protein